MFYKLGGNYEQPIQVGPLKMSWRQVVTGFESALVVAPINTIIALFFQKGAEKYATNNGYCHKGTLITGIAWFLFLCSCTVSAAFSIFYSLIWENSVSEQWLSSMLISFAQDITITEPVKVFFTALTIAVILRIKAKRSKVHASESPQQAKTEYSKQKFWALQLSEVEKMRRRQAKKQNLTRYFTELLAYLVFVFLLVVVCYGNRNDHRYLMTKSIRDGLPSFSRRYASVLKGAYFQLELTLGRVKARAINELAEANTIYAKVFAFLILFTLTILCINFFIGIINDAFSDAKNNVNENELYKLIDDDRCPTSEERKEFFDAISKTLSQSRASQKSVEVKEKESENVGLDSKNHSNLNFDLISKAIVASREKRSKGTMNKQQYNTRKQSLFDKISNMLKSLKGESNDECSKRTEKKKVRFQEDIVESSLCKLRKRKHDLLQRLERIVSGFSEEDEDFHYLLKTAEARNFKV
ncbi:Polycystic kidney disease protein 1-like 2 [Stylophora pistillata]|uniref:Polycystic kidney disease protein 1-like 2 n=1 Tax=Stylophora pistillata TaxID=50429 RepID=A0A2B4R3Y3_STYPI|nr:Polycystic kidney disease protein 1-like 2 [Stylophora pistillata]